MLKKSRCIEGKPDIKAINGEGVRLGRVGEGRDTIGARPLILPASVNKELGRGKVEGFLSFPHSPSSILSPPSSSQFLLPIPQTGSLLAGYQGISH